MTEKNNPITYYQTLTEIFDPSSSKNQNNEYEISKN